MPNPDSRSAAWRDTGYRYHGAPVYVSQIDGTMAYEADFERLVSLPEHVEEQIVDEMMAAELLRELPAELLDDIQRRAN